MPAIFANLYFHPRTCKQIHTPIRGTRKEGAGVLMEPFPWVFDVFLYFGKVLPMIESLFCPKLETIKKRRKLKTFDARHVKYVVFSLKSQLTN